MVVTNTTVLKRMWSYARPLRWAFFAILALVFAISAIDIALPFFYKRLFDGIAGRESVNATTTILHGVIFSILLFSGIRWLIYRINGGLMIYFETKILRMMDQGSFAQILEHSQTFFSNNFAGVLSRRVKRFSEAFERIIDSLVFNIVPLVTTVLGSISVLMIRDPRLGIGMIVSTILIVGANWGFSRWRQKYDLIRSERDSEVSGAMTDTFVNTVNVKMFARESFERDRFDEIRGRHMNAQILSWGLHEASMAVQTGAMLLVEVWILWIAVDLWQKGILTIGDFALIQAYLIAFFERVWNIGNIMRHLYGAFSDAREMVETIETPVEVADARRASTLAVSKGEITFSGVDFHYHQTRKVIDRLSLTIKPGERVALVGSSGAGKSTMVKLLLRLSDPSAGRILIDGQDIRRVTQESLRSQIAFVPQESVLFHRTLGENIRYARLDATQEELERASKLAHCHEFIDALPDKYETYVGERGIKLSGGERQRVAIARAILKDAPILVLDEATSSLDSESEALIQDALQKLMAGRTTVAIAHRLSTIMQMDRIIVLDGGKIVDEGTHTELLERDGLYRRLWNIQAGGFVGGGDAVEE